MSKKDKTIKTAVGKMIIALSVALDKYDHHWTTPERSATSRVMKLLSLP